MSQTHNRKGFYPVNADAKVNYYPIKASQSLKRGDAVIIDTLQVAIAVAGSAALLGVVARDCASLDAGTLVPVYDDPDTVFVGRCDAASDSVGAGSEVDLVGATGAMLLDVGESTTDVFKLIRAESGEDVTATAAAWRFKINKHLMAQID